MKQNKEIPKGYKDSPLGIIPEEWEVKRLGEICSKAKLGGNYENSESNEGVPVIKMGNIGRGNINLNLIQYLPSNYQYDKCDILREGDLLFNTRNTLELVGKVAIWNNELPLALYNSNLLRIDFKEQFVASNIFMNYYFNSYMALKQLKKYATGTTSVAAIYTRDLEQMKFLLPPISEQQKIAEILSTWDKATEKQTALIEKLELRKRGLMQQLLTGKKQLTNSTSWQMTKAGSLFKNVSNKGFENEKLLSATQENGVIPRDMLEGRVTMPSGETKSFKLVEIGDFVISLRSFQGGIEYSYYRGVVSPAYTVLKPKKEICNEYYKQYFKSCDFISRLAVAVIGIRDGKQISYDDFCFIKIPSPSLVQQIEIANILIAADKEIDLARIKLSTLRTQKNGLMQQFLTGKKRININ